MNLPGHGEAARIKVRIKGRPRTEVLKPVCKRGGGFHIMAILLGNDLQITTDPNTLGC